MIISHKYKFIFIKTYKTAGTSIEVYLSEHCGDNDIVTPIYPHVEPHKPRNFTGKFNLVRELINNRGYNYKSTIDSFIRKPKFYNHIPASSLQQRIPKRIWNSYYKFCLERNPWDKSISQFHMIKDRMGGELTFDEYLNKFPLCINYPHYTDRHGKLLVDEVIKYEDFNSGLGKVFSNLGIPFQGELNVRAKSEHRKDKMPYQHSFTSEQKNIIADKFKVEIALHNYSFWNSSGV